jgi:hypothetical protein
MKTRMSYLKHGQAYTYDPNPVVLDRLRACVFVMAAHR